MTIDVYASAPWYLDHLRPVYDALGSERGALLTRNERGPSKHVLVASYGDKSVVHRMGYRIALMQHGAGQSYGAAKRHDHPSYPGGRNNDNVELFLAPNQHSANRWRAAYPNARVEVIGCPKLDTLPRRHGGGPPTVAVSFHWDYGLCPETMSCLNEYRGILPLIAKRWKVLGHGHPRRRDLPTIYKRSGIEYVPSFADILRRADLYICDNSSSMFEFAATGRPVVVLNSRAYRREAGHGLRFWDAADVGIQVNRPDQLIAGIERALELRPEDVAAREAALDLVYSPRTGSAKVAAAALRSWSVDSVQPAA